MKKIFSFVLFCFLMTAVFAEISTIGRGMGKSTESKEAFELFQKGLEYLDKEDLDKAQSCFEAALKEDSKFTEAYDELGIIFYHKGDYKKAIKMYKKAISLDKTLAVPYINLGLTYYTMKNYPESAYYYSELAKINKDDPESYYGLATIFYNTEIYPLASFYMEKALQRYYEQHSNLFFEAAYYLGFSYFYQKHYEDALEMLEIAAKYYQNDEELLSRIHLIKEYLNK